MLTLPKLIIFNDYNNNWELYEDALYGFFKADFIDSRPIFDGIKLALKKYPLYKNKETTFWHLITEGKEESTRTPEFRRCERICWPKPIIENSKDSNIKLWEAIRNNENRIHICYGAWEYLVVLSKRKGYILLWTAYPIKYNNYKRKLEKEYNYYIKSKTPP